jgi:hypothetical protein
MFTVLNFFYAWNIVTVMWKKKHLLQSHNLACHTHSFIHLFSVDLLQDMEIVIL